MRNPDLDLAAVGRNPLAQDLSRQDPPQDDAARFAAIARRDRSADGHFVYAVRTTGVYCRPSCAARPARPENVSFHPTCAAAEAAGFRACRRCRPNEASLAERQAASVARACRRIEAAETPPALAALAAEAGLSPYHFHRVFKQVTGVTPRAYAAARRATRVAEGLRQAGTVTEAIYEAGYSAASRFYAASTARLGMTPTAYRRGGEGTAIRFAVGACSLGHVLVAATASGVCAILLGDDPETLVRDVQDRFPKAVLTGGDRDFEAVVAQAVGLVEAPGSASTLPLDIGGTAFQQRVWQALRAIPPGRTATYAEVAQAIGAPSAARAVALACGANAIAVAIPCHRVVRQDGSLSGYRWGVARKRALLDREREAADRS
ncbi:bifunctional DNA-binding transcriptional regulator/O6-methylguanine-DNA methyltransferase Ada [Methylobacterium nonmethylotrophicum]|uniref:methylated-DNA--[protein]-cysteine S-methyltransferase n=2 Tax=Methylobacterium nonmethylotrophicum TaxID=1141884 RepID=A0A4Z0NJL9_9HYPH|nr:bifunctional DNA-binding transcriptional regulator/O6-methylguanine-DNA methyltransferase Ada [Methylobacterium nonmethylotrophicum]